MYVHHGKPDFIPHNPDLERYPHVDFKEIDVPAILEEIKILKDWCKSLTELHLRLQQMHNEDYKDTIEELQKIIDTLNSWVELLTKELSDYFKKENDYAVLTVAAIDRLNGLVYVIADLIGSLADPFKELFDCIENRLHIFDNYFRNLFPRMSDAESRLDSAESRLDKIDSYISNIYEALTAIVTESADKATLVYGTDYSLTWYNNFYAVYGNSNAPQITRNTITLTTPTGTYYTSTLDFLIDVNHYVSNTHTASSSSGPQFSHGSSYTDVTSSWIYRVVLNDSKFSTANLLSSQEISTGIWNMSPTSQRASWSVKVNIHVASGGIYFNMVSIADGYNTQYTQYSGLSYGQLNMHHQAVFKY